MRGVIVKVELLVEAQVTAAGSCVRARERKRLRVRRWFMAGVLFRAVRRKTASVAGKWSA